MKLKVCRISEDAKLPSKGYESDACLDLFSAESCIVAPHSTVSVSTGLVFDIPEHLYVRIYPRSSMSMKGIVVGAGIVDPGYVGEIKVVLHNVSDKDINIPKGSKIAQFTIHRKEDIEINEVDSIDKSTDRKDRGFGSTGE